MKKKSSLVFFIINLIVTVLMCAVTCVFALFYIDKVSSGFIDLHSKLFKTLTIAVLSIILIISVIFIIKDKEIVYKFCLVTLFFLMLATIILYVLQITGFWDKIDSVEDFRAYIESFGSLSVIIFLLMQVLQVAVLPIPGFIAIGAGVLLFGALKGAIYSFIGIMIGSLIAFFVGKYFGYKVVCWLVGKKTLDDVLQKVKGKDKLILTFMFLFPFFPDDVLCFVAGISSMSNLYFIIMITVTRLISVFTTSFSLNGNIIPYNTWWGVLIWIVLIVGTFLLSKFVYKNGEAIQAKFKKIFKRKKNNSAEKNE